jgi:hypothetical protein
MVRAMAQSSAAQRPALLVSGTAREGHLPAAECPSRHSTCTCMAYGTDSDSEIQTATHTGVKGMMQILNLGYLLFTICWSNDWAIYYLLEQ